MKQTIRNRIAAASLFEPALASLLCKAMPVLRAAFEQQSEFGFQPFFGIDVYKASDYSATRAFRFYWRCRLSGSCGMVATVPSRLLIVFTQTLLAELGRLRSDGGCSSNIVEIRKAS